MIPLYEDMDLTDEVKQRVRAWVERVGFAFPGASTGDVEVVTRARYVGFMFTHEDLETFAVGLRCTKPGMTHLKTTIRMSHGQLTGADGAPTFEPHPPVTAADCMRMNRWRARGYRSSGGEGVPGIDLDLAMLQDYLGEIISFGAEHGTDTAAYGWYELSVQWGVLLAGRLPRIQYYAKQDALTDAQTEQLTDFYTRVSRNEEVLRGLELPFPRVVPDYDAAGSGGAHSLTQGKE